MTGFAAIIHFEAARPDDQKIKRMAGHIARHGNGKTNITFCGSAALAVSPLDALESPAPQEPLAVLPNDNWIIGDIRVDAREQLLEDLRKHGHPAAKDLADTNLVLHAYQAWGEQCLDYLLGDFAFVIWNEKSKRLFAARDSFGVKPFYYFQRESLFVFSNSIDAIRAHPGVSNDLNESAICDFLVFGYNLDEHETYFNDISRLPPSHALHIDTDGRKRISRYDRLEVGTPLRYKNVNQYAEHFLELFQVAVGDRLRSDRIGFELSGGLDSTSCAAMAAWLNRDNPGFSGKGFTTDNSHRDPNDQEARYAAMVANKSSIGHETLPAAPPDDFFAECDTSQPYAWPFAATLKRFASHVRQHGKVMLSGHGGDPYLNNSGFESVDRFRTQSLFSFSSWLLKTAYTRKSIKGLGLTAIWNKDVPRISLPPIPGWIDPAFLKRSGSIERWRGLFYGSDRYPPGCTYELAWDELKMPMWSHIFEDHYHDLFRGVDCRHPFFDIRLANFFLATPASIKNNKALLRRAGKTLLPAPLLERPKTGATSDLVQTTAANNPAFINHVSSTNFGHEWINIDAFRTEFSHYIKGSPNHLFTIMCPISLELWVKRKL